VHAGSTAKLLDAEEGQRLLAIARRALEEHFQAGGGPATGGPPRSSARAEGRLVEPRGVFVTLTRAGELRGCTGYVEGVAPVADAVRDLAISSATRDRRFTPVRADELAALHIEVSVLTPPRPIRPDEIEIGRHGLIARLGGRSGLLLPQVAPDWGWDAAEFLERTCEKAGLPRGAWREQGFTLLGFEAQIFEEAG
jgi:AmmeMemoRadiSam system protein A